MTALAAVFEATLRAAEVEVARAATEGRLREERLAVAGLPVRLRIAARRYGRIVDLALAHLRSEGDPGERALTVLVVDESDGGARPPLEALRGAAAEMGAGASAGAALTGGVLVEGTIRSHVDQALRALSMVDLSRGLAVHWLHDVAILPWWAAAAPLRTILACALTPRGAHIVHAGAVGTPSGGVLLAGKSGSGKSTTSLACLDGTGLLFAGDDHVAVDLSGEEMRVHALYSTAKLFWDHAGRFPRLAPLVSNAGERAAEEKALLKLHPDGAARLSPGFPVRAILLPRVAADRPETRAVPATRGDALLALAPTTTLQIPGSGAATLAAMRAIVERAPCFRLELGSDIARIPEAIEALLARLASAPGAPRAALPPAAAHV